MRKLFAVLCLIVWPVFAAADDGPILLKQPWPDGLVPPKPSSTRQAISGPRPPTNVMYGHDTVVICFLMDISAQGRTTNVAVLKHSDDSDFDDMTAKALRALHWKPAELGGRPVAVRFIYPIVFRGQSLREPERPAEVQECSWDLYKPDGTQAAAPKP